MKIKLVFHDWCKLCKSIYSTEEGIELSLGDFHSGTTFDAEIELDEGNEKELKRAIKNGYQPTFYVILGDQILKEAPDA